MISAIEIYNKPSFAYREEAFTILALNAWELLIKAKLLSVNNNDPRAPFARMGGDFGFFTFRIQCAAQP